MNASELARRYVEDENGALREWEALITDDPERAWPVFVEIVALRADDETLYQVSHRLRLLLHRHWDAFHERAEALVRDTPRFSRITGVDFFDPERYRDQPLDIEELILAHEEMDRHSSAAHHLDDLIRSDPERALPIAIEIIHRGPAHGASSFDTFGPLSDLLRSHTAAVIDRVEEAARESYLVRRCIWRMSFTQRAGAFVDEEAWQRLHAANGGTTDFTDDMDPQPAPRQLSETDETIIASWFAYEQTFWAFCELNDLVGEEPATAWQVFLEMLKRCDAGSRRIGFLAAGPLEDLLRKHADLLFDRIAEEAKTNEKLREALTLVYVFEDDAVYERYTALMAAHPC